LYTSVLDLHHRVEPSNFIEGGGKQHDYFLEVMHKRTDLTETHQSRPERSTLTATASYLLADKF
jgi:hypothetical protein